MPAWTSLTLGGCATSHAYGETDLSKNGPRCSRGQELTSSTAFRCMQSTPLAAACFRLQRPCRP